MNAFAAERVAPVLKSLVEGVPEKKKARGETVEVRVCLKGYDPGKDKRFKGDTTLPYAKRKGERVLVLAEHELAKALEGTGIPFVLAENYRGKEKEKKRLRKKLVKQYHSFITVASVYKVFEPSLFSAKKKPVYMIRNVNEIQSFYEEVRRKVTFNLRPDMLIGFPVGASGMAVEELAQNFAHAMQYLLTLQKRGMQNIRSVYVKTTQGKVARFL